MCGIAGTFNLDGKPADRGCLNEMIEALAHRGPDDRGCHLDGCIGLGHARLSIVDVGGGHQPMTNEDSTLWLTFNGEIFNYVELRRELEGRGHRFATRSDAEVILHLYEEKGEDCVKELNGEWAFAIWDSRRRKLFLTRDRLGVRPLFYTTSSGAFMFASEMKALFTQPGVDAAIDVRGLDQIFTFWSALAPRTIFRDISELPPGSSLSVDAENQRLYAYWQHRFTTRFDTPDTDRCAAELLDLLTDATRIRLRSDVPVGAYLSGGIDSTVVTSLAQKVSGRAIRTFSLEFADAEFDESRYQQEVAAALSTDHSRVQCTSADIARMFPEVVWHGEKPILRTAPAPMFALSRLVRDSGYKVVLTGEGADEVLGGYDIFKEAKIRAFWAQQPESSIRPLLLRRLYPYLSNVQAQSDAYLQAFFRPNQGPSNCFFSHAPRWQLTSRLKAFFSSEVKAELGTYRAFDDLQASLPEEFTQWDWFSRAQFLEATILLPGYILSSQGDRVTMAHGVEGRFPFLDHRVVEFAGSLSPRLKMKVLDEKYILKRAAGHLVPLSVRTRVKQPFRAPDVSCFVDGNRRLPDYAEAVLAPPRIAHDGIFDPVAVAHLLDKVRSGRAIGAKDNMAFVGILSTQLLIDRFLRPRASSC